MMYASRIVKPVAPVYVRAGRWFWHIEIGWWCVGWFLHRARKERRS